MKKRYNYWTDFTNLEYELRVFMQQQGKPTLPTASELLKAGRRDLLKAIYKHGGTHIVAESLGLRTNRKPRGYWADFANLKRELQALMKQQGYHTLPTRAELRKANLLKAIHKHGGIHRVAEKLGLTMARKPPGYWTDFANLERELRALMQQQGQQTLPTERELQRTGRNDLVNAIYKHGGKYNVAEKLGLTVARKPADYWANFANLERELRAFMQQQRQPTMPTDCELLRAARGDLLKAINKHGGTQVVSEKLGLTLAPKTYSYWSNFANLERELRAFMQQQRQPTMPTESELHRANRSDLVNAIYRHGGIHHVAEKLGLSS